MRDQRTGLGYRWNAQHRNWARSFAADGFDPELQLRFDRRLPRTPAAAGEARGDTA